MRSYYAKTSGARIPYEPPASAWNPLDMLTAQGLPPVVALTNNNRTATRHTVDALHWEAGVRGTLSHGGIVSEKWYLELKILSAGSPGNTQNLEIGLVDATATNVLSRPPLSDTSEITNRPTANYVLAYTRSADGPVYTSYPASTTYAGSMDVAPFTGDVYSFAWDVGTSITVRRNNGGALVVPYTSLVPLFPYMSAGDTLVNGPDLTGTGESVLIQAGRKQQTYSPPTGYASWG